MSDNQYQKNFVLFHKDSSLNLGSFNNYLVQSSYNQHLINEGGELQGLLRVDENTIEHYRVNPKKPDERHYIYSYIIVPKDGYKTDKMFFGDEELKVNDWYYLGAHHKLAYTIFDFIREGAHKVIINSDGNGTVQSDVSEAAAGDTVNLTVMPNEGYAFDRFETTPAGLEISNNSFKMPDDDVTITAYFSAVDEPTVDPESKDVEESGIAQTGDMNFAGIIGLSAMAVLAGATLLIRKRKFN